MAWRILSALLLLAVLFAPRGAMAAESRGVPLSVEEPTLTAEQIDAILDDRGSPSAGLGWVFVEASDEFDINTAVVVAMCIKESNCGGTGASKRTNNVGNLIWTRGNDSPYWDGRRSGRWRAYDNRELGIRDMIRLLRVKYVDHGLVTVRKMAYKYALPFENDTEGYINTITALVNQWTAGNIPAVSTSEIRVQTTASTEQWCRVYGWHKDYSDSPWEEGWYYSRTRCD